MTNGGLSDVLQELVALLEECGQSEHARWLEERMLVLDNPESTPADREAVSREVHAIVTGMGGLLDLSLIPNSNSSLSEMSAADRRDRLADALYTATA